MKNGSPVYFIIAVLIILVSGVAIYQLRNTVHIKNTISAEQTEKNEPAANTKILRDREYPQFVTGVMEPGNIRLELKPEEFEDGVLTIRFFANAHDLVLDSYDFASMTTLEHKGVKFRPEKADQLKGHHDSGLMTFKIGEELNEFSVTVEGLPKEELRVFKW